MRTKKAMKTKTKSSFIETLLDFFRKLFGKKEEPKPNTGTTTTTTDTGSTTGNETEPVSEDNENQTVIEMKQGLTILIDNGHGYDTKGKRSPYLTCGELPAIEYYEYKWNREIANELVKRLVNLGYDARLVVTEENDISLSERVRRANIICNEKGADNVLFISIHGNAAGNGSKWMTGRGWSAYTCKGQTKSDVFAEMLYNHAKENFKGMKIRTDKTDGDSDIEDDFTVIAKTKCPAVLTENFFYDNVDDVKFMLSEEGRDAIITTHIQAIEDWYVKKK